MRPTLYAICIAAVMGLAFWAYQEGYRTRAVEREVRAMSADIAQARRHLAMLRAEWSYLNRPDRLRVLAEMNFERLGLMPLRASHYGRATEVPFPLPPPPDAGAWVALSDKLAVGRIASLAARQPLASDGEQLP